MTPVFVAKSFSAVRLREGDGLASSSVAAPNAAGARDLRATVRRRLDRPQRSLRRPLHRRQRLPPRRGGRRRRPHPAPAECVVRARVRRHAERAGDPVRLQLRLGGGAAVRRRALRAPTPRGPSRGEACTPRRGTRAARAARATGRARTAARRWTLSRGTRALPPAAPTSACVSFRERGSLRCFCDGRNAWLRVLSTCLINVLQFSSVSSVPQAHMSQR